MDLREENDSENISWCKDEKVVNVDLDLKNNGGESSDNELYESALIERIKIEKEDLDQKESDLSLNITCKKGRAESNVRNIGNKCDYNVMETEAIKKETIEVNEITTKKLNYCQESSTKSEIIESEELYIKDEEDNENSLNEKIRKSENQLILHQCPQCPYKTGVKRYLAYHSIKHKKLDESDWYSCQECPYKTYRKGHLTRHAESHKRKEEKLQKKEIDVSLKASHKITYKVVRVDFNDRMQKSESQQVLCQCPQCPYKTNFKSRLTRHSMTHKKPDEIVWYSCPKCPYKTSDKSRLERRHAKIHISKEERLQKKKCNGEKIFNDDSFTECALVETIKIDKEDLEQNETDLSSKITCKSVGTESIDRNIDNKSDNGVRETIKKETIDVGGITTKELNYCQEESFKLETIEQEEVHIKDEEDNENILNKKKPDSGKQSMYQCPECSYTTTNKNVLKAHSIVHKKPDEVEWYRCQECPYKTRRKGNLKEHGEIHKSKEERLQKRVHQCPECPYKAFRKSRLKYHVEAHKNKREMPQKIIYQCPECPYKTSRKRNLNIHEESHIRKEEILLKKNELLRCLECSFKTSVSSRLRKHVLAHKSDAFKCSECSYQSRTKQQLTIHQVKHESTDKWHSCPLCPYKSYNKCMIKVHSVRRHGIVPNNSKGIIKIFKCTQCSYQGVRKCDLKVHQLTHDQSSWYQCPACPLKTPHIASLKNHQLQHQGEHVKRWYKCLECSYKSLVKANLQKHLILHKSADEIQWFECSQCSFKTARKRSLKQHQLKHKEVHEVEWFCCYKCSFKTNRKSTLVTHLHVTKHRK